MDNLDKEVLRERIKHHNDTHLIQYRGNMQGDRLEDLMLIMAKNMETALKEAGAEKGKDYNILDLFKLGSPFALEKFKTIDNMSYAVTDI